MAIVKANYTKVRRKIKASVRYIQHRPGKEGERRTRTLFGRDGSLTRDEVYQLIDDAPTGTTFFRLVFSPDPRKEDGAKDLNLRELTEHTMLALAKQLQHRLEYVGVVHADHAEHRHVHVIALIPGRLTREDLQLLRQTATEVAQFQRRERDLALGITQGITHEKEPEQTASSSFPNQGGSVGKLLWRRPRSPRRVRGGGGGGRKRKRVWCSFCLMENCGRHTDGLQLK